jgi:hypothetical protein
MKRLSKILLPLFLGLMVFTSACDSNFSPFEENTLYDFTMYGTFDLYADTHWVRVMPISTDYIPNDSIQIDIEVTITQTSSGDTRTLNDSLFNFGGQALVLNYWIEYQLEPEEEYIIRAESPDGRYSSATITIPSPIALPTIDYSERSGRYLIEGVSAERLVVLKSRYKLQQLTDNGPSPSFMEEFSHLDQVIYKDNNEYMLTITPRTFLTEALFIPFNQLIVNTQRLTIATGSESWPELEDLTEDEMQLPDVVSNVENGTGYVAGFARRIIPLESCYNDQGQLIPCEALE